MPAAAGALKVLASQERRGDDELVFPGRFGDNPNDLKNAWAKIRETAALEGVRLHDLRHSYASILASFRQLLSHTQPATTARYAHLFDEPLREATERVSVPQPYRITSESK